MLWKGYIVCWCGFDDKFYCSMEELTDSLDRKGEGFDQLSKYLVPYNTNKRVDQIAEELWRRYLPEALTDPRKRAAFLLADKMGLTIQYTLDARSVLEAVQAAVERCGTPAILNSDQGSQLTSEDYKHLLRERHIRQSMDR